MFSLLKYQALQVSFVFLSVPGIGSRGYIYYINVKDVVIFDNIDSDSDDDTESDDDDRSRLVSALHCQYYIRQAVYD